MPPTRPLAATPPCALEQLTPPQRRFFTKMANTLDCTVYFYGSITRSDYLPGKSDIDAALFSDNPASTLATLRIFLGAKPSEVHATLMKLGPVVVYGHKMEYRDPAHEVNTEISVYDTRDRSLVLREHMRPEQMPLHCSVALVLVKHLFYTLQIISAKTYQRCKRFLMNSEDELKFIKL